MSRRPKFNPEISRVKLNPEQAVLQCACFGATAKVWNSSANKGSSATFCNAGSGRTFGTKTQSSCAGTSGSSGKKNAAGAVAS